MMSAVSSATRTPATVGSGTVGTAAGTTPTNADLMRAPSASPDDIGLPLSLEQLLTLSQTVDSNSSDAKTLKIQNDNVERKKKLDDTLAEMKKQAEDRDSPGFFGSIVKIVKDFATDLVTNPAKIASDLGSNIKAALDSPNFWGDLKKICMKVVEVAAVAASAVATVFSAGAAGIAVAAVVLAISALNFAQSEFNIAKQMGLSPKLAAGLQLGLSVVAIALSFGTNTGAAVGAARAIKEVTTGIQVAGTAVGGVATVADSKFQSDALDRQARIKSLQSGMDTLNDTIKELLEQLGEHKESAQAVTKGITDAVDQQDQTTQSISAVRA